MSFRRTRALLALVTTLAIAAGGAALPSTHSSTPTPSAALPPTGAGVDISYPQCIKRSHEPLPPNVPFAVIGVNGGKASNFNPCFESEYVSAYLLPGTPEQPGAAVYVNTGNPGIAGTWWPTSNDTQAGTTVVNPNGTCAGLAGAGCAYIYGYSMAQADYRRVTKALVTIPGLWWLDVETSNTWQADTVANAASLSGMVDYFKLKSLSVGIYSTSYQWNRIAGVTPATSTLAGLPSWLAGSSYFGAPVNCQKSPLTPNGRVAMVQYVMHLDNDYACRRFEETFATISPANQATVGSELTGVSGEWSATGVTYLYQWNRDGLPIAGEISDTYIPTALDAGSEVSVTITGLKLGYSTASDTSPPVTVLAGLTP